MTNRMLTAITIGFMLFWMAVLALIVSTPASAHEGPGTWHPVDCPDVEVPEGITCWSPGTYAGQQDVDSDHGESYHLFHPVCEGITPGTGSSVGEPYWYECLPETGATSSLLAIIGGSVLAAGAAMLILGGIAKGVGEADDA